MKLESHIKLLICKNPEEVACYLKDIEPRAFEPMHDFDLKRISTYIYKCIQHNIVLYSISLPKVIGRNFGLQLWPSKTKWHPHYLFWSVLVTKKINSKFRNKTLNLKNPVNTRGFYIPFDILKNKTRQEIYKINSQLVLAHTPVPVDKSK